MNYLFVFCLAFSSTGFSQTLSPTRLPVSSEENYGAYHRTVAQAHKRIAHQDYQEALDLYQQVFNSYRFVFLKDYKVATQLALQLGRQEDAFIYLRKAMAAGWTLKEIKKAAFLKKLQRNSDWKIIEQQRDSLRSVYRKSGNSELRSTVKRMFSRDQRKALLALFTFSAERQDRYAEKKFAPHSEQQLAELNRIMDTYGYPGEKLIHNRYWTSVILSHHNSISRAYNLKDSLYPAIRPRLLQAIESGEMTPEEFVRIDDWYIASTSGGEDKHYGHLISSLTRIELEKVNRLREEIGIISVETANRLIDLQTQTGMNFYFPSDLGKKIAIVD
ncbi:tetratricopeptide repeat protein [Spirosoma rigui]|uniref:tetratricopeptide repeat protein n=1 Tax=Spirosoma rigui TaxID=564064 RepID=UPI0009B01C0B|nr:tetratricopeptide repeat protein [Spirosoma rigui]